MASIYSFTKKYLRQSDRIEFVSGFRKNVIFSHVIIFYNL